MLLTHGMSWEEDEREAEEDDLTKEAEDFYQRAELTPRKRVSR